MKHKTQHTQMNSQHTQMNSGTSSRKIRKLTILTVSLAIILGLLVSFFFFSEEQAPPQAKNPHVVLETSMGSITLEIYNQTMPITAGNFLKLTEQGFYDGVIFHRVIPNFMIQGGDPQGTGRGGPGYTIQDEFSQNNSNERGTIAMANAGPNTGGSQFFINVVDNSYLNSKHPVFGKVIAGMEVADSIANAPRDEANRPKTEITIIRASIVQ